MKKILTFFYLSYNSHFSHIKTSILADLKYIIIFLKFLLFNEIQHLKVGYKRPKIVVRPETRPTLRYWGLCFYRKTRIYWGLCFYRKTSTKLFQSTCSDILKDVKGCEETNNRPLHTNNI